MYAHAPYACLLPWVAEIQSKTKPKEWWWVPGEYNPADITTRVTSPCELDLDSIWQKDVTRNSFIMLRKLSMFTSLNVVFLPTHDSDFTV
jgi:hypothetical protein